MTLWREKLEPGTVEFRCPLCHEFILVKEGEEFVPTHRTEDRIPALQSLQVKSHPRVIKVPCPANGAEIMWEEEKS